MAALLPCGRSKRKGAPPRPPGLRRRWHVQSRDPSRGAMLLPLLAQLAPSLPPTPHLRATRVESAPILDGRLDDAAWKEAAPTSAFTQKFPNEAQPPTERT